MNLENKRGARGKQNLLATILVTTLLIGVTIACDGGADSDTADAAVLSGLLLEPVENVEVTDAAMGSFLPSDSLTNMTVSLFQHGGYAGYSVVLAPGAYNLSQLTALGMQNDDISSVLVPVGMATRLFQHGGFSGWELWTENSISFLGDKNDDMSSITVGRVDRTSWYQIKGWASGRCLNAGASTSPGTNLSIYDCVNGLPQQVFWFRQRSDGYYTIQAKHSGLCLDVKNSSTSNAAEVRSWTCNESNAQRFKFHSENGKVTFRPKHSGKCLDVYFGNGNGSPVKQHSCHGGDNQRWTW